MTPRISSFAKALFAAALLVPSTAFAKQKETVVYSFGAMSADGTFPQEGLIADKAGNMYGTTIAGGLFGKGAVFVVGTNGLETVIYSFAGTPNDGEEPNAALTMDGKGNLYGTTLIGGAANKGTVFQLKLNGENWQESVLHSFCALANCADGNSPAGAVTVGPKGVLFGTTQLGGLGSVTPNNGTVFRLDPPGKHSTVWTETVLYGFCNQSSCADGKFPYSQPVLATDGFLYGTASQSQQGGALYRVSPGGGDYSVLHIFTTTGADGQTPIAGLTPDKNGIFYGATRQGGTNGCGTVYSFNPSSFVYQQLYSCKQSPDPSTFYGGVTVVENKHGISLYGASLAGGANAKGAIFSLTPPATQGDPWNEQTLYSFCAKANCVDGSTPGLVTLLNISGVFYGTTTAGGHNASGTLFRFGKK